MLSPIDIIITFTLSCEAFSGIGPCCIGHKLIKTNVIKQKMQRLIHVDIAVFYKMLRYLVIHFNQWCFLLHPQLCSSALNKYGTKLKNTIKTCTQCNH